MQETHVSYRNELETKFNSVLIGCLCTLAYIKIELIRFQDFFKLFHVSRILHLLNY